MSPRAESWVLLVVGLSALFAALGAALAIVRRRDLRGWTPYGLALAAIVPLLPLPDRALSSEVVHGAQALPWVAGLILAMWVPTLALPAILHPGPEVRPTTGEAGVALALAALILVPATLWKPSPLPILAFPLIAVLTVAALRTSERLITQRRAAAELATVAAAAVFGASAVWDWFTSSVAAWTALAVIAAAAVITDRVGRLAGLGIAACCLSAVHQGWVAKGGLEAWAFELRGGTLPPASDLDRRWGAYDPTAEPVVLGDPIPARPVLLLDADTPWTAVSLPAYDLVDLWFVVRGDDGYLFHHGFAADEAYVVDVRKLDDGRFSVGGAPPVARAQLAAAVAAANEDCPLFPLLSPSGPWTVGEIVLVDMGMARRALGTCRWDDGTWVDDLP